MVFHNIVIHNEPISNLCFLCVNYLETKMAVNSQRTFIVFVTCQPDGAQSTFLAERF